MTHGDVMLLAPGEVSKGERGHVWRDKSDLRVDGPARFHRFVFCSSDGVQHVGVQVRKGEGVVENFRVEDEADLRGSRALHVGNARKGKDGFCHRAVVFLLNGDDEVEVADGFASSACRTRQRGV